LRVTGGTQRRLAGGREVAAKEIFVGLSRRIWKEGAVDAIAVAAPLSSRIDATWVGAAALGRGKSF